MAVVLKLKFDAEMHRVILDESKLNWEAVQEAIHGLYPTRKYVAKYLDAEGDLITLCHHPASFEDFLTEASKQAGRKILKLELFEIEVAANGLVAEAQHV